MNNVTLIGMPGSGKSTIGVILAKALRYEFLDSDLLIQKQEKRKLSEIIEQDGPEKFKEIENQVNADIHVTDTVIAPGGSVIYCDEAMEHLKSIGKVIYLKLSLESLSKRLGNLKGRGKSILVVNSLEVHILAENHAAPTIFILFRGCSSFNISACFLAAICI